MSAVAPTVFRLLNEVVGWDPHAADGLTSVVLNEGVLELESVADSSRPPGLRPPALAWQCERCTWWLGAANGLYRLGPCDNSFVPTDLLPADFVGPVVAIASWVDLIAVTNGKRIVVVNSVTGQLLADTMVRLPVEQALAALGFMDEPLCSGPTLVAGDDVGQLHCFDLSGLPRFTFDTPSGQAIASIAPATGGGWAIVVVHADGSYAAVPCAPGTSIRIVEIDELPELTPWPELAWTNAGFCIPPGCFSWSGEPVDRATLGISPARWAEQGQYLSVPLNSGIPLCRWHRVRIDADIPAGTGIEVAFATTDGPTEGRTVWAPVPGSWGGFPVGDPHPDDWTALPPAGGDHDSELAAQLIDGLLFAAAGQHGYLRIRLTSDGYATPRIHQVRLDMPRQTSASSLPRVFLEDPVAADFTERFLSLFDAHLETIDTVVQQRHDLLDASALPTDALIWLARMLGTGFEAEMTEEQRRALLAAAPDLYRRRGTPGGLIDTLQVLDINAAIQEHGTARPWASLGDSRLGGFRLFDRATTRVRLGSSPIGAAPLHDTGNPDDDALLAGAHQISVHVGPTVDAHLAERIVRSQSPAHLSVAVHQPSTSFNLSGTRVGLGTVLVSPAPIVVGTSLLGREHILQPRSRNGGTSHCAAALGPLH